MKKIGSMEISEVTFKANGETLSGLYLHDTSDTYSDGDIVVAWDCDMPENEDELKAITENEYLYNTAEVEDIAEKAE